MTGAGGGTTALLHVELRRAIRNKRTLIFSAVLPVTFFLAFSSGGGNDRLDGLSVAPYVMTSMAVYGVMNALFTGGGLIGAERSVGWNRQLRIAGLPGSRYVATKVVAAYVMALPGLIAVLVAAALVQHVHLPAVRWVVTAVAVLAGLLPIAALGVLVGYVARPQTLQALFGIGSALLALLGGLWVPASTFPRLLRDAVEVLPTYWSAATARAALRGDWVGWHGAAVLIAWTLVLGALAARAYRSDSIKPGVAGTT